MAVVVIVMIIVSVAAGIYAGRGTGSCNGAVQPTETATTNY